MGDRRGVEELVGKTSPAVQVTVSKETCRQGRALMADLFHLGCVLEIGDDHPELSLVDPVFDVPGGEHRGTWRKNSTELDKCNGKNPPLRDPRKHDQHTVALLILYFKRMLAALFDRFARSRKLNFFSSPC